MLNVVLPVIYAIPVGFPFPKHLIWNLLELKETRKPEFLKEI